MGRLVLIWMAAIILHEKLAGRLVPAVCWGFFALRDDDRITPITDSLAKGFFSPTLALSRCGAILYGRCLSFLFLN
ncbi:hypothetical protein Poly41_03710 [Novipirellula artificiosorum]|uniref:Uncharacterized protein n=2 Tax=Novipirellula artificiosorum TaxID=2528016 RepID=A0A5C6E033_9BACT|nr:hypothetical protein Poly41_03710 [Novipirellula artificiosorum]